MTDRVCTVWSTYQKIPEETEWIYHTQLKVGFMPPRKVRMASGSGRNGAGSGPADERITTSGSMIPDPESHTFRELAGMANRSSSTTPAILAVKFLSVLILSLLIFRNHQLQT